MRTIVIASSCCEEWGGSEELWARSIYHLQELGYKIIVVKEKIHKSHPRFVQLEQDGVLLWETDSRYKKGLRILKRLITGVIKIAFRLGEPYLSARHSILYLTKTFQKFNPRLVIVAQGSNIDGLDYAYACAKGNIPYIIISQKAVDFYWPLAKNRASMVEAFIKAKMCFFVSQHNLRITEEQFGIRLSNSQVVYNPVKVPVNAIPYPDNTSKYHLACIGRLFVFDKGQDILLRILAQKKWANRPLKVSFVGTGIDEMALKEMANLLDLQNVEFIGFEDDIHQLWSKYHALILPSRNEGMPLVILEAMAAGRTVITTKAGGNAEIVEDGINGFLGEANEISLDETLERAWNCREKWATMGIEASRHIARTVPASPEKAFVEHLTTLINSI